MYGSKWTTTMVLADLGQLNEDLKSRKLVPSKIVEMYGYSPTYWSRLLKTGRIDLSLLKKVCELIGEDHKKYLVEESPLMPEKPREDLAEKLDALMSMTQDMITLKRDVSAIKYQVNKLWELWQSPANKRGDNV